MGGLSLSTRPPTGDHIPLRSVCARAAPPANVTTKNNKSADRSRLMASFSFYIAGCTCRRSMFPQAGEACRTDPFGPAARLLRGDYAWQSCGVNVRVPSMNLIKSAEIDLNE